MSHLASESDRKHTCKDIAGALNIPAPFLSKILQILTDKKLLKSAKGRGGGFELAKSPDRISLMQIKVAIDGMSDLERCALGIKNCSDKNPCPFHDSYGQIRRAIHSYLKETTLADLASAMRQKQAAKK